MLEIQFVSVKEKSSWSGQLAQVADLMDEYHSVQSLLWETFSAFCDREEELDESLGQGLRHYIWWLRQWSEHLKSELHYLHEQAKAQEMPPPVRNPVPPSIEASRANGVS